MQKKNKRAILVALGFVLLVVAIFVSSYLAEDRKPQAHYEDYEQGHRLEKIRKGLTGGE